MPLSPGKKKFAVAAALLGLGGFLWSRRAGAQETKSKVCSTQPLAWNEAAVRGHIAGIRATTIAQGQQVIAVDIARQVAMMLYPEHTWPPGPGAPSHVVCVWDKIVDVTTEVIGPTINWPEIVNPLISYGTNAQAGKFLQVQYKIAPTIWSHSAIKKKPGVLDVILENANVPNNRNNRHALYKAIVCSPWNDAILTTEGKSGGTGTTLYAPVHGRGISMLPVHADNLQRMLSGRPPRRRATSGKGPSGGHLPLVWIPDIERGIPSVVVKSWPDGRSAVNPPQEILDLGLENVPPGSYGCDPWRQNAAPLQY